MVARQEGERGRQNLGKKIIKVASKFPKMLDFLMKIWYNMIKDDCFLSNNSHRNSHLSVGICSKKREKYTKNGDFMTYCSNLQGLQHLYPRSDSGWRLQKSTGHQMVSCAFLLSLTLHRPVLCALKRTESGSHIPPQSASSSLVSGKA